MQDELIPGEEKTPVYKKSAFTMRSGNSPLFKMMGSSPARDKRSWRKKAWDKATQIGMGLKKGLKEVKHVDKEFQARNLKDQDLFEGFTEKEI